MVCCAKLAVFEFFFPLFIQIVEKWNETKSTLFLQEIAFYKAPGFLIIIWLLKSVHAWKNMVFCFICYYKNETNVSDAREKKNLLWLWKQQ